MKRFFLLSVLCLGTCSLFATHNRSGYIRCEQSGEFSIEAVIITLTDSRSRPADRDTLTICWGDGTTERVVRNQEATQVFQNDVKRNMYVARHTYLTKGSYTVCMTDPNRNSGILNVNAPNSAQVAFHLQTTITLLNMAADGGNSTPQIIHEPLDLAYVGATFVYQPNVWDAEGDSVAFELITPMSKLDTPVPNFVYPNEVGNNTDATFTLDELTGELIWDVPELVGEYNIAILIKSYRNGEMIDATVLDMQILALSSGPTRVRDLQEKAARIRLFPNPTVRDQLQVEDPDWEGQLLYRISDQEGRILANGKLQHSLSVVDLRSLVPGTYYLSILRGRSWISKAFVLIE
ncbi:MAG: hypothetical protein R2824_19115 [Saprospiraceae bacterium]|nr:hypothetical protein [Lewinella sp.]